MPCICCKFQASDVPSMCLTLTRTTLTLTPHSPVHVAVTSTFAGSVHAGNLAIMPPQPSPTPAGARDLLTGMAQPIAAGTPLAIAEAEKSWHTPWLVAKDHAPAQYNEHGHPVRYVCWLLCSCVGCHFDLTPRPLPAALPQIRCHGTSRGI